MIGRSRPSSRLISACRSGDITLSPDRRAAGSPGSSRMKEKAMIETPMKVGTRTARRPRRKRSMRALRRVAREHCKTGVADGHPPLYHSKKGSVRKTDAPFRIRTSLLGDVDAAEGMVAERAHHIARHFLGHRHDDGRMVERHPRGLALEDDLRLLIQLGAFRLVGLLLGLDD